LKFPRVRQAIVEKGAVVKAMLAQKGIDASRFDLYVE
jgi:hypothetical protein